MKTCWIVQDYRKPVHVFECEDEARAYAGMAGTEDLYEALFVEENPLRRLERTAAMVADAHGVSLADIVESVKAGDTLPGLRDLAGDAGE